MEQKQQRKRKERKSKNQIFNSEKFDIDIINLDNLKETDLIVIRVKNPPLSKEEEVYLHDLYEKGFFGEAKVIVIKDDMIITRENINNFVYWSPNNDN